MKALMLVLWASVVPLHAYVLQPNVSVTVIEESEEESWSDWIRPKWYPPAPGSVGILTKVETKEDEDHISDIQGFSIRDEHKEEKRGGNADAPQGNGNEQIHRLDSEEKVRNEVERNVKDEQVNRADSEELESQKFREIVIGKHAAIAKLSRRKPLLHMEDMTFTHVLENIPVLQVENQTVTQTTNRSTFLQANFPVSPSPVIKCKNVSLAAVHNTAGDPACMPILRTGPLHQHKEQKGSVTMTTKIGVLPSVVMPRNISTGSQKQRLVGSGPKHNISRPPKKAKPTTDTLIGKKVKPQKKGKPRSKSKPEKNKKQEKKQKTALHFPYFKDEYCPPECTCYGRVVQCSDKGVDKMPYGIPYNTRYLLLMNNQIDTIQVDLLREYLSLELIVLTNNRLTDGSVEGAFEGMRQLKHLFLDHNRLISVPADLPASLEELHLDGNNVSLMSEAAWSCCPALHLLILTNNCLGDESIPPGVFSPLVSLHTLTLSHNHLRSIPLHLPQQLRELYLRGNHIKRVTGRVFPHGSELLSLDLSVNHLTDAGLQRNSFLHSRMLESLNLEGNLLRSVPRYLPASLRTLNLEGNAISSVSKRAFRGLLHLEHLGLSRNQIAQVAPGAFRGLAALHQLDLSHNDLREVPRYIPPTLHSAFFSYNRISSIPRDAFCVGGQSAAPSSLVKVHLEHNLIDMKEMDSNGLWCLRGFQVIHFY